EQEHALDHYLHHAALQVGRLVNYMKDVAKWSLEDIVSKLARPKAGYPQRLKLANLSCDLGNQDFIHNAIKIDFDVFANLHLPLANTGWQPSA
ncbi:hypothetical protein HZU77_016865, partial [Neisseriaceae bacterium TC5R-5]|nr:hypothetical protein [Neisseriaceae bacterium TC5R-5]